MKVYCRGCKHFLEPEPRYWVNDDEKCAVAGDKKTLVPGTYRDEPGVVTEALKPSEKNKNNDCKDWKARG